MSDTKLHTQNYGGNLHDAATSINKAGLADYVLAMSSSGLNTVVVFRMPKERVWDIRKADRGYCADPHHDDELEEQQS